ncbi:hypothetical protein FHS00_000282 [Limimaricola variabilis]|uniref:Uncharacterized protein n=1 Tax=Limimaricola variabilis TaxID=1492771 RepID=A0ABR6HK07_9RHOB|nr:hypothetical protein [Limimaricola variabilis]
MTTGTFDAWSESAASWRRYELQHKLARDAARPVLRL